MDDWLGFRIEGGNLVCDEGWCPLDQVAAAVLPGRGKQSVIWATSHGEHEFNVIRAIPRKREDDAKRFVAHLTALADQAKARRSTPAGWYPEPGTGRQRYWDGQAWTEHYA